MFRKFHEKLKDHEEGFTLIELLVVILIIAILAAIAIPVFLRQREKGWVSQVESALKNAATAEESYATGAGGKYTSDPALLTAEGLRYASDVTLTPTVNTDKTAYCVSATHANISGKTWAMSGDQSTPKLGTCNAGVFTAAAS